MKQSNSQDREQGGAAPGPQLSVIVPAYNAAATIARCLGALAAELTPETEIIVVDDGSSDATREVAARFPVQLIAMGENRGTPTARNRGVAAARGATLFFLDADVVISPGLLTRGAAALAEGSADAIIGSYDDAPAVHTVVSRFKNLAHHYFHQRSGPWVTTFWGACGLIRRDYFLASGGFDESHRWLEDVGFGYRLTQNGARIGLDRSLQVKHLKRWTLGLLIRTDFHRRAMPWAAYLLEYGYLPEGLNFKAGQRLGGLVALGLCALPAAAIVRPPALVLMLPLLLAALFVNLDLFRLFFRKGGMRLALGGFVLQQLYYLIAITGLAAGVLLYGLKKLAGPALAAWRVWIRECFSR